MKGVDCSVVTTFGTAGTGRAGNSHERQGRAEKSAIIPQRTMLVWVLSVGHDGEGIVQSPAMGTDYVAEYTGEAVVDAFPIQAGDTLGRHGA